MDYQKCIEAGEAAKKPLIKFLDLFLNDKKGNYKEAAEILIVLGRLNEERAFEITKSIFKDGSEDEILIAADILEQIGNTKEIAKGIEVLLDVLQTRSYYTATIFNALDILNWLPKADKTGAEFYINTQKWDECANMGELAIEPLLAALNSGSLSAALTLGKMREMLAVAPIIKILKNEEAFLSKGSNDKFDIFWQADQARDFDWIRFGELTDKITKMKEELELVLIGILGEITGECFIQAGEWIEWGDQQKIG